MGFLSTLFFTQRPTNEWFKLLIPVFIQRSFRFAGKPVDRQKIRHFIGLNLQVFLFLNTDNSSFNLPS